MKSRIILFLLVFGLNQIMAQNNVKPKPFKQPEGFVQIKTKSGSKDGFYVMKYPVSNFAYKSFITYLYEQNRFVDANTCKVAIPASITDEMQYIVLTNPSPIEMYAEYIGKQCAQKDYKVSCRLVNESEWKQIEGAENGNLKNYENKFGLSFYDSLNEWKLNKNGKAVTVFNIYTTKAAAFRLVLIVTPIISKK